MWSAPTRPPLLLDTGFAALPTVACGRASRRCSLHEPSRDAHAAHGGPAAATVTTATAVTAEAAVAAVTAVTAATAVTAVTAVIATTVAARAPPPLRTTPSYSLLPLAPWVSTRLVRLVSSRASRASRTSRLVRLVSSRASRLVRLVSCVPSCAVRTRLRLATFVSYQAHDDRSSSRPRGRVSEPKFPYRPNGHRCRAAEATPRAAPGSLPGGSLAAGRY